jgi:hypothetical protein
LKMFESIILFSIFIFVLLYSIEALGKVRVLFLVTLIIREFDAGKARQDIA